MEKIDCSYEAYKRLVSSGIHDKIIARRNELSSFLNNSNMFAEPIGNVIFENAENIYFNKERGISEKSVAAKDVLMFEKKLSEVYFSFGNENLFLEHPSFLSQVVLDDDMDYLSKGFPSLRLMYESIVSYCLGNRWDLSNSQDHYIWRNENMKNEISLNVHGDFFVYQNDISSKLEKTLFGEEFEGGKVNHVGGGICSYQDSSNFLYAILKYAEHVGMRDIPEIVNWEKTLDSIGSIGTATTECLMGGGSLYGSFFENVLPVEGSSEKTCPISFYSSGNNITIPIVGLDGNLYIKDYDYEDKISVDNYRLKFSSEDIPDLIKGTYRLFTRDKTLLPKIMNGFLKL